MTFGTTEDRTMAAGFGRFVAALGLTALLYVASHGITALCVAPLQSRVFGDATTFASLLYLPHGIRVLSIWLFRWTAVPGLILGAALSEWLFTDPTTLAEIAPVLWPSILVGALSAAVVFESLRQLGASAYAEGGQMMDGRTLFTVGMTSSLLNSIGQMIVFDGFVSPGNATGLMLLYAFGDMAGVCVVLFAWAWIYRQVRRA